MATRPRHDLSSDKREGGNKQVGRARSKRGHTGRAWSPARLVPLGRRAPAGRGAGTESCSRAETRGKEMRSRPRGAAGGIGNEWVVIGLQGT